MNSYKYHPTTKEELREIIAERINNEGNEVDLNDIDVSGITDMSYLFEGLDFNGNISKWNVSKVTNMEGMFYGCRNFNQDISCWSVSKVILMYDMFYGCKKFDQDISKWDVSNVTDMGYMFSFCEKFNQDISTWNVLNVDEMEDIFDKCPIKDEYKPKF